MSRPLWRSAALSGALVLLGGAAAWQGGLIGLFAAGGVTAALTIWLPRSTRRAVVDLFDPTVDDARSGASLAQQVVPVWQRSVEAARSQSDRSMEMLVQRFASLVEQLDRAVSVNGASIDIGATDELIERHRSELDELLSATRAAVSMHNRMLDVVTNVLSHSDEMTRLANEVQHIGRATHLLALNASVEATRAGERGGGFAVVAHEVRELASQSRHAGTQIARKVGQMQEQLASLRAQARKDDLGDDEIELQATESARRVIRAMVGSLSDVSSASRGLRDISRQVQRDVEDILMGLQSQDRFGQMLGSVTEDMARMDKWFRGAQDPASANPAAWLERLEASYTMEEMRTAHHDTVAIDRQAGVEFF